MLIGVLLVCFGKVFFFKLGGDKIGCWCLDIYFRGFEKLGVKFVYDFEIDFYSVEGKELMGIYFLMDEILVMGIVNVVMVVFMVKGII